MSGFVKKVADLSKKFVAQILLVIIVILFAVLESERFFTCLLYTSPSPRDCS